MFSMNQDREQNMLWCITVYLLCFLDLTDLLSSSWVVESKGLPTHRVLPLIVDENLHQKKKQSLVFQLQITCVRRLKVMNAVSSS